MPAAATAPERPSEAAPAQEGATVAIHYLQNHQAAADTLARVRDVGADGLIVQADVSRVEEVRRMFAEIRDTFGRLDIFVSNARGELPTFYEPPLDITLDKWTMAVDSQARAFLVGVQEAVSLMPRLALHGKTAPDHTIRRAPVSGLT